MVLAVSMAWSTSAAAQREAGAFEPVRAQPGEISVAELEELYGDANRLIQKCRLNPDYARRVGTRRLAEAYYIRVIYGSVRLGHTDMDSAVNMLFLAPDMAQELGIRRIVDEEGWPDAWLYRTFGPEAPSHSTPEDVEPAASAPLAEDSRLTGPAIGPELPTPARQNVGLKVRLGAAYYYQAFFAVAVDGGIHLKPSLLLNLEFQAMTADATIITSGIEEIKRVTLFSWAVGLGYKYLKRNVRPYMGLDYTVILYQVDPAAGARFAPGFRGRAGLEFMVDERFGLFVEGHLGGAYARYITEIDDDRPQFQAIVNGTGGIIIQL